MAKKKRTKEYKTLGNVLLIMGIFLVVFIASYLIINSMRYFEYQGLEFDIMEEGDVTFYHTSLPLIRNNVKIDYNIYLRNDPRELEKIPVEGKINLFEMMVINSTDSFVCDGDGGISMYNFQQIMEALGIQIIQDPDAGCDSLARYSYIVIKEGNTTSIEQTGPSCYDFNVNNCEILPVMEKFLVETIVRANNLLNS